MSMCPEVVKRGNLKLSRSLSNIHLLYCFKNPPSLAGVPQDIGSEDEDIKVAYQLTRDMQSENKYHKPINPAFTEILLITF